MSTFVFSFGFPCMFLADDPSALVTSVASVSGRERSDSALSNTVSDGDCSAVTGGIGSGSTSNLLDSSHDANAMLQAVQTALMCPSTVAGPDSQSQVEEQSSTIAHGATTGSGSIVTEPSKHSSPGLCAFVDAQSDLPRAPAPDYTPAPSLLSASQSETVGIVSLTTSSSAAAPLLSTNLDGSEVSNIDAAAPDGDQAELARNGDSKPIASAERSANIDAPIFLGKASADSDLASAYASDRDQHLSESDSHDVTDGASADDLVLQSYDRSLPAHFVEQHAEDRAFEEETAENSPAAFRRYNSEHLATLDSACKLSPPSRRHLHCLALSKRHVWIADNGEYIYCWSADTSAWLFVKGAYAVQLATGRSSHLLWALSRQGIVSARVGMSDETPLGRAWMKLEKLRLKCVAIDDNTAWLITRDGQLMRRRNVSTWI